MSRILTVTLNPAVDVSTAVENVTDTRRLRCDAARKHPGGGGINVARVITRLGGDCVALYLAGGPLGEELRRLIEAQGVRGLRTEIAEETRESFAVYEKSTGRQFRFVLPGPTVSDHEWHSCIEQFNACARAANYVVLSGSLPPGIAANAYAGLVRAARAKGTRIVLDSSGPPLRAALEAGVFLVKPSLGELCELSGRSLTTETEWREAALAIVRNGQAQIVVLTLGSLGALLVSEHRGVASLCIADDRSERDRCGRLSRGRARLGARSRRSAPRSISLWRGRRIGIARERRHGALQPRRSRAALRSGPPRIAWSN